MSKNIWRLNQDGEVYSRSEGDVAISEIFTSDRLVHEIVNDDFDLVYPGDATIGKEVDDGEVLARRYFETTPVVVQKGGDEFEIRGRKQNRKDVAKRFKEDDTFDEVEPSPAGEAIADKMQALLVEDNDEFRLIGVEFADSELPENSRLRVKNERAIYEDLRKLSENNTISIDGISEVSKLHLKDIQQGGKFRIELTHGIDGVEFELKTNHKLDDHRERFRNGFTQVTGIEFDKVYEYGSQDQEYLFNRILAGRGDAYEKYYDELSQEVQNVLEGNDDEGLTGGELLTASEKEVKACEECSESTEASIDECNECGSTAFSESVTETIVEVNDTSVATYIQNKLSEVSPTHPKRSFSAWEIGDRTMAGRKIVTSSFASTTTEGGSVKADYHEVEIIPQGNHPRPATVNNYLLKCVYVTFGQSASAEDEGYGRIPLYDIITNDSLSELVGNALHGSIIGIRDRLLTKSGTANNEATEYYSLLEELGPMHQNKDQLEAIYDPDNESYFEKHLFWLLKGVFSETERWGRVGERETDGVLIIPKQGSSDYYIGTYDAKLSHRKDGYDLATEEEDQATRYILSDAERDAIENRTGDREQDAHILISQNFSEDGFSRVAGHIRENLDTYSDDAEMRTKFVFMEFRAVLQLNELQREFWSELRDSRIRNAFESYVVDALNDEEVIDSSRFVHFDTDSIQQIKGRLLSHLDGYNQEDIETHRKG